MCFVVRVKGDILQPMASPISDWRSLGGGERAVGIMSSLSDTREEGPADESRFWLVDVCKGRGRLNVSADRRLGISAANHWSWTSGRCMLRVLQARLRRAPLALDTGGGGCLEKR